MTTPQATRPLADELEFVAERIRDESLPRFVGWATFVLTSAMRQSGMAELMVDPESDEMWLAKSERIMTDLGHIETVLVTMCEHLGRDNHEVDRIYAEQRGETTSNVDEDRVTVLERQTQQLVALIERLLGEQGGGVL